MYNSHNPIRVLLIDDEQMSADMLEGMFAATSGVTIRFVSDPTAALDAARAFQPSVMLVDLRMPGTDGLHLIRQLRQDPATTAVPLVMLSTEIDPHVKAAGFAAGAADYVVKWPDRVELTARVRAHANAYHIAQTLRQRTEELAQAQAALHEAQKMEAVGQLAGAVAHDVNNILHIINGHLQLMRVEHPDERSRRRIDAATEGVKRGTQLTKQLLATARDKPQASERVDLATFLRGIEATVLNTGAARPCRLDLAEGAHVAALDPIELQTILVELVKNAREASQDDGAVSILLDSEQVGMRAGRVPAGNYVRISVVDTGEGMAPEVQRRAFEPFFGTRRGQGAGLGLSLAAGFARRHQGHIDLESEPGRGTTVTLRFPRHNA